MRKSLFVWALCLMLCIISLSAQAEGTYIEEETGGFIQGIYIEEENVLHVLCGGLEISDLKNSAEASLDGQRVEIVDMEMAQERNLPMSVYCLVDESDFAKDGMESVKQILQGICESLGDGDNLAIETLGGTDTDVSPFLDEKAEMKEWIGNLTYTGGNTDLYKGIADALKYLRKAQEAHNLRCLIILSAGGDGQGDGAALLEAYDMVEASGIPVYAVTVRTDGNNADTAEVLDRLAQKSAGGVYYAGIQEFVLGSSQDAGSGDEEIGKKIAASMEATADISLELSGLKNLDKKDSLLYICCEGTDGKKYEDNKKIPAGMAQRDLEGTLGNTGSIPGESDNVPTLEPEEKMPAPYYLAGAGLVLCAAALFLYLLQRNRKKETAAIEEPEEISVGEPGNEPSPEPKREEISQPEIKIPKRLPPAMPVSENGSIGMVHHIGKRKEQQDTLGVVPSSRGLLAVVSDGMGGLSDGDMVSQKAVFTMMKQLEHVRSDYRENPLYEMLGQANAMVNQMLGADQIYKSGATMLAVLIWGNSFQWVAVGDSRIYLYCGHRLVQVNREHIYKLQLIERAVNREIDFASVERDSQKDRLMSFLGMGDLKLIDGSLRPVELYSGDKLLLMSDGVFNTLPEKEILRILETTANAQEAAARMERAVLSAGNPRQDNFTCVILDF